MTSSDSSSNNKSTNCNAYYWMGLWGLLVLGALSSLAVMLVTRGSTAQQHQQEWILVGGVTSSSAVFRVHIAAAADDDGDVVAAPAAQLVVSASQDLLDSEASPPVFVSSVLERNSANQSHGVHAVAVDDGILQPNTVYHYGLVRSQQQAQAVVSSPGHFRTPAPDGTPWNFTIALASCAQTGSRAAIFDVLAARHELDLFLHMGDLHYENIGCNCLEERLDAVHAVLLASRPQAELYRSTALVYMWDDHDWLGNGSMGYEAKQKRGARTAALQSYDILFPHYPLPAAASAATEAEADDTTTTNNNSQPLAVPPYHAFTMGTVRFIVSDLRSESTDASMYSDAQWQWLQNELSRAASYDFVVWVTTKPYVGPANPGSDSWKGQPEDRRALSDFITTTIGGIDGNGPQNLIAVAGDAHMVAFDDGSNTYFGGNNDDKDDDDDDGGVLSFPILHSGPLDRTGSIKGGPYSHGCRTLHYEHAHQYSTIRFEIPNNKSNATEAGAEACLQIDSYRVLLETKKAGGGASRERLFSKRLCGKIFVPSAPGRVEATCAMDAAPVVDRVLFGLSVSGLLLTTAVAFHYHRLGQRWLLVCLLVCASWCVTLLVGISEIFANGLERVDFVAIFGIMLGQTALTVGWIGYWGRREALQTPNNGDECNGETATTTVAYANNSFNNNESVGVRNANSDSEDKQVNDTERNGIDDAERDEKSVVESQ